jgi:hypothetical protein
MRFITKWLINPVCKYSKNLNCMYSIHPELFEIVFFEFKISKQVIGSFGKK